MILVRRPGARKAFMVDGVDRLTDTPGRVRQWAHRSSAEEHAVTLIPTYPEGTRIYVRNFRVYP